MHNTPDVSGGTHEGPEASGTAHRSRLASRSGRLAVISLAVLAVTGTALSALANAPGTVMPTTYSIWPSTTVPKTVAENDTASVEIGTRFSSKTSGWVTAVRYYKSAENAGPKTARLWDATGRVLGQVVFSNESREGWQEAKFNTPVTLKAGSNYVVSYRATTGRYANDQYALSPTKPKITHALTATQGVYTYGSGMPQQSWRDSNYYVDVVFTTARPGTRSWRAPTSSTPAVPSASVTASSRPAYPSPSSSRPSSTSSAPWPSPSASATSATPTTSPARPSSSLTSTPSATSSPAVWPDATNTGVVGCPPLDKIRTGGQVTLSTDGQTYENKEFLDPTVLTVHAKNVSIRCVKFNGTGWYGIDNTDKASSTGLQVDRVDINCLDKGQVVGMLVHDVLVSRVNVSRCDHMLNVGGDNVTIKDSYCHGLTDLPVVHADCIQSMGGNTNLRIEHNSLWSRDTSDILLGQEYGEARNVVINNNRLMSEGTPPPAYLLYLTGTNTVVTNNRFTKRYTYGHCTHNNAYPYAWSGNVWDETGAPIPSC